MKRLFIFIIIIFLLNCVGSHYGQPTHALPSRHLAFPGEVTSLPSLCIVPSAAPSPPVAHNTSRPFTLPSPHHLAVLSTMTHCHLSVLCQPLLSASCPQHCLHPVQFTTRRLFTTVPDAHSRLIVKDSVRHVLFSHATYEM